MTRPRRILAAAPALLTQLPASAAENGLVLAADTMRIVANPHEALITGSVLATLLAALATAPAAGATLANWLAHRTVAKEQPAPDLPSATAAPEQKADRESKPAPSTSPEERANITKRRDLGTRLQQVRDADKTSTHGHAATVAEAHLKFGRLRTADELISKLEYELTRPRKPAHVVTKLPELGRSSVLLARDEVVKDEAPESTARPTRIREHAARGHAEDWVTGDATLDFPQDDSRSA